MYKKTVNYFIKSFILRQLIFVSIPIVIQMLVQNSFRFIDLFMVGKLGTESIAAVGITNNILFPVVIFYFAITSGLQIFIAQYFGNKNIKKIEKITCNFLTINFILALIIYFFSNYFYFEIFNIYKVDKNLTILSHDYFKFITIHYILMSLEMVFSMTLRSIKRTSLTMKITIIGALLNTIFNYILIFGKFGFSPLGIKGAGIATIISSLIINIIYFIIFIKGIDNINIIFKYLYKIDFSFLKKYIFHNYPLFIQEICWILGQQFFTYNFSILGTASLAAKNILNQTDMFFLFICWGFGIGTGVIVGNDLGGNFLKRAYYKSSKMMKFISKLSVFTSISLLIFIKYTLPFFKLNDEAFYFVNYSAYIVSFFLMFKAFNISMLIGILRSAADNKYALFIESASVWFSIPIILIYGYFFKISFFSLFFLVSLEEVLKSYLAYKRYISKIWIKKII